MNRPLLTIVVTWGLLLAMPARGDWFVLNNGGKVEGVLLNPKESPREKYVVRTAKGAQITLEKSQVKQVVKPRPEELEYEKIKGSYPDTIDGQMELATWCRDQHLTSQRRRHLERVLALDANHAKARRELGYVRVDGDWKTQDQIMTEKGFVKHGGGKWLLPQEIELRERERKNELAEKEWKRKLKLWRDWLTTDRVAEAIRLISEITDPYAVPALVQSLEKDLDLERQKIYFAALSRIDSPQARHTLADNALKHLNEDIRLTCLEYLETQPDPDTVDFFIQSLHSKDNILVNRAAIGLAHMQDPIAIGPLIDALVTVHKFQIVTGTGGGMGASFDQKGGLNSFGAGGGPRIIKRSLQNPSVLDALVQLAQGPNFEYDVTRWEYWFVGQKKSHDVKARRD